MLWTCDKHSLLYRERKWGNLVQLSDMSPGAQRDGNGSHPDGLYRSWGNPPALTITSPILNCLF